MFNLGFKFEGVERAGELFPDGRFVDLEVYSKPAHPESISLYPRAS